MDPKELGKQPAHPIAAVYHPDQGVNRSDAWVDVGGMTKREAFAMAAMQGLIAWGGNNPAISGNYEKGPYPLMAREAVNAADALLAELAKEI